jgi:hypothetical protein
MLDGDTTIHLRIPLRGNIHLVNCHTEITRTLYHVVVTMKSTFVERNAQGDIILAVIPPAISTRQLGLDTTFMKNFVDRVVKHRSRNIPHDNNSSENTINFGYSSSDHVGNGHYLHQHLWRGMHKETLFLLSFLPLYPQDS